MITEEKEAKDLRLKCISASAVSENSVVVAYETSRYLTVFFSGKFRENIDLLEEVDQKDGKSDKSDKSKKDDKEDGENGKKKLERVKELHLADNGSESSLLIAVLESGVTKVWSLSSKRDTQLVDTPKQLIEQPKELSSSGESEKSFIVASGKRTPCVLRVFPAKNFIQMFTFNKEGDLHLEKAVEVNFGDEKKATTEAHEKEEKEIDVVPGLVVGSKVDARYSGGSRYYGGKVAKVNVDGSFDIRYDDGDFEEGVKLKYIKGQGREKPPKSPKSPEPMECKTISQVLAVGGIGDMKFAVISSGYGSKPSVGDKCTAQFRGRGRFYPGSISRTNDDGTVNIEFDDGDEEDSVDMDKVRLEGGGGGGGELEVGTKVEARYRGRSKYYSGMIAHVRLNGTYDVHYDDGEKELGVKRDLIKGGERGDSRSRSCGEQSVIIYSHLLEVEDILSFNRVLEVLNSWKITYKVGQKVQAKYRGKGRRFESATVQNINR